MKPSKFRYLVPANLDSAVAARANNEDSVVLSGGQSLVPTMNFRLSNPDVVIDLRKLDELNYVRVKDDKIRVGAMTRQRFLEQSDAAFLANPLIRRTMENIAHPAIRNRGTVGGSLAHADPAAELPCLLSTLRGEVVVQGTNGRRTILAEDFFEFIFTTSLEPDELLIEAAFPALRPNEGWSFLEFSRRHGDFAIAAVAATVLLASDGSLAHVRLGASGISTRPVVLKDCEELLLGSQPSLEAFEGAGDMATNSVDVSEESGESSSYRKNVLRGLVVRTLLQAVKQAGVKNS